MEYPDNAVFAIVGYIIAAVVLLTYTLSLHLRIRRER